MNPEKVWIRLDRGGVKEYHQIPFWVISHLRAICLNETQKYRLDNFSQYKEYYQEGFKDSTIADWLQSFNV